MRIVLIKMDNCVIFLIENGDYIIFTETNHGLTSYILYIVQSLNIHITLISEHIINNHLNF